MFVVHPINVCGNVPLVGDDGDGFAVVVFESHLNHVITFCCCLLCPKYIIYIVICQPLSALILEFYGKFFRIAPSRCQ